MKKVVLCLVGILILSCNDNETKVDKNTDSSCFVEVNENIRFDTFWGLLVNDSDSTFLFNYLGNSDGTHPGGIFRYNIHTNTFDSVVTHWSIKNWVMQCAKHKHDDKLLLTIGRNIWEYNLIDKSLNQLTFTSNCFDPSHVPNSEYFSYTNSVQPESGIWKIKYDSSDPQFIYEYSRRAVWNNTATEFITLYAPDKSLKLLNTEGEIIDILIEPGVFSRIYTGPFSNDDLFFLFSGKPIDGNPYQYYIYKYDLTQRDYTKLALGTFPVWSVDQTEIFYLGISESDVGVWRMDLDGCEKSRVFSLDNFLNFINSIIGV